MTTADRLLASLLHMRARMLGVTVVELRTAIALTRPDRLTCLSTVGDPACLACDLLPEPADV